jgi:hypothetical protein
MVELMNQGAACHAIQEHRDDIDVSHTRDLVTLSLEASNVISEGSIRLFPAALQVLGVSRTHVHALEVASEDPSEVLLAIDDVS